MKKSIVILGALFILLAVILGAMGAHALKEILSPKNLDSFETAVRYQMYMGLAILMLGLNYTKFRKRKFNVFIGFLIAGVLLFSFSIYGLVWADATGMIGLKKGIGPITPLGGMLMIIGWILFILQFIKTKNFDEKN